MRQVLGILILLGYNQSLAQDSSLDIRSMLTVPISISLQRIEQSINESISHQIYRDTSYINDDEDNMTCIVWKDGNIKISSTQKNVLQIEAPVKVHINKRFGTFGLYTYHDIDFRMILSFQMVWNVLPSYQLFTRTIKNGYVWIEKPKLKIKGLEIPVTPIVEKILDKKQQEYANLIDLQVKENINFKKEIISIWNQLADPSLISEEYKTYMAIQPRENYALPFQQDSKAIYTTIGLEVNAYTSVGTSPIKKSYSDIPNLRYVKSLKEEFEFYTLIHLPYEEASQIGQKMCLGEEFEFENGKFKVKIEGLRIYPHEDKLGIETTLSGSFKGKLNIFGHPVYDTLQGAVRFEGLDYHIETKNILHKTANWLFNKKILTNLQTKFQIPMQNSIQLAVDNTNLALNQKRGKIQFTGEVLQMNPTGIRIRSENMNIILLTRGKLKAKI